MTGILTAGLLLGACSGAATTDPSSTTSSTIPGTTSTTTSSTTTTSTTSTSTTLPPTETVFDVGSSVQGRPIEVVHRLDLPGASLPIDDPSRVVVLVVGVIHGDEQAGLARDAGRTGIGEEVDSGLLQVTQVLGVVDVPERIHVRPTQGHGRWVDHPRVNFR